MRFLAKDIGHSFSCFTIPYLEHVKEALAAAGVFLEEVEAVAELAVDIEDCRCCEVLQMTQIFRQTERNHFNKFINMNLRMYVVLLVLYEVQD